VGPQSGDDPQHRGFAAAGRANDGDQFALVWQIVNHERNVLNRHAKFSALAERFGDFIETNEFGRDGG
jgi:hypothetical protein